jgi:hypothetical protein
MKTESTWKWMLAGVFFLTGMSVAHAQVAIDDKDAFEKRYIECVMSGLKNKCFSTLAKEHFLPDADKIPKAVEELRTIDDLANSIKEVYKVHHIDKVIRAGTWDARTYAIEHSDGKYSGAYLLFVSVKGKWYVSKCAFNSSGEFLGKLLKLPIDD